MHAFQDSTLRLARRPASFANPGTLTKTRIQQLLAAGVLWALMRDVERRYATSVLLAKSTRMRTQPVHALSVFLVNIGLEAAAT